MELQRWILALPNLKRIFYHIVKFLIKHPKLFGWIDAKFAALDRDPRKVICEAPMKSQINKKLI